MMFCMMLSPFRVIKDETSDRDLAEIISIKDSLATWWLFHKPPIERLSVLPPLQGIPLTREPATTTDLDVPRLDSQIQPMRLYL